MKRRLAMAICGVVALSGAAFAADPTELKGGKEKLATASGWTSGGT